MRVLVVDVSRGREGCGEWYGELGVGSWGWGGGMGSWYGELVWGGGIGGWYGNLGVALGWQMGDAEDVGDVGFLGGKRRRGGLMLLWDMKSLLISVYACVSACGVSSLISGLVDFGFLNRGFDMVEGWGF